MFKTQFRLFHFFVFLLLTEVTGFHLAWAEIHPKVLATIQYQWGKKFETSSKKAALFIP